MHADLFELLRCPFCGTRLSLVDNAALDRQGAQINTGVIGCECCAYPIVAGIPVLIADGTTREAIDALEAGHPDAALFALLGLIGESPRVTAFRALLARATSATYRETLDTLSPDAEGTYFVYRFSDPTYLTAEALLVALGQVRGMVKGCVLDLCGGSGHLTRVLTGLLTGGGGYVPSTVLADVAFWKLWMAARFTSPGCVPVCCDANQPLPFARDSFSMVVLSDAFPYVWHKRLLADEMIRLVGPDGLVAMPHLHNALGDNVSAGDTLSPGAYQELLAPLQPRLYSDARLLTDLLDRRVIDLTVDMSPEELGTEPSLTLVASRRPDVFRTYAIPDPHEVSGELRVNPLYRVERRGGSSFLTLTFPSPEYESEFGECRRYLPNTATIDGDLTGVIQPNALGANGRELRRRRVVIDMPARYY